MTNHATDPGLLPDWPALLTSMAVTPLALATVTAAAVGCCSGSPVGVIAIVAAVGFGFHALAERN